MVKSGLIHWWPFHEWSGTANDLVSENNGSINGSIIQGIAGIGGLTAYSFAGSSGDNVGVSSTEDNGGSISYAFWVKLPSGDEYPNIIYSGGNRIYLEGYNIGRIAAYWIDANRQYWPRIEFTLGEWNHLALTFEKDSRRQIAYLNGEYLDVSFASSSETRPALGSLNIADKCNIDMADFRIYNRELSFSEVKQLYNKGSADVATPPDDSDSNSISRWNFEDRSDTSSAKDAWGNNDGTINGAVYSSDAPRDDSLSMSFDGTDDYANINSAYTPKEHTITAWVNTNSPSTLQYIYEDGSSTDVVQLYVNGSGEFNYYIADNSAGTNNNVNTPSYSGWAFVVAKYDGSDMKIYLNGVERDSLNLGITLDNTNSAPFIGDDGSATGPFDGKISDLRIYSRALTHHEIQQLYQYGTKGVDLRSEVVRR